jgi:hypothetical protein
MTACDDRFEEFVHPLVHCGMEKNDAFGQKYGRHSRWDWDNVSSTMTFSDPNLPTVRVHCSVVGTTQGTQWQSSWANKNISPHEKLDMEMVRDFGEANGYEKLTIAFLDADEYTGWEMTAVTEHILNALGAYRFPTDQGYCYLAYRSVEVIGTAPCNDLHGATDGASSVPSGVNLTDPTGEALNAKS